jgi:anti-sigma factor RsiW
MGRVLDKLMRPDPPGCEEARRLMSAFLDGELDDAERRRVQRHVRFCSRCHTVLGNLRRTLDRMRGLRGSASSDDASDAIAARVSDRVRERIS